MTSSSDTDQHPDVEEISDLTEGLLPPSRTTELQDHLDSCALCADVHRSLMEIRDLLGALPGPAPMPADVAERIDAALAAEALLDATPPAGAPTGPRATVPAPAAAGADARSRQEPPEGRQPEEEKEEKEDEAPASVMEATEPTGRTDVSRETSRSPRAPGGPGRSTRGPSRTATGPGRGRSVRRRRSAAVLGTALGIAVLGVGAFLLQGTDTKSGAGTAGRAPSPRVTTSVSGTDEFSGAKLETRVDTLLAPKPSSTRANPDLRGNSPNTETATDEPMMQAVPQVPYCVRQGTGRSEAVIAAQQGTYRGIPAYLLVLANPSDEATVRVYVVDATCVDATPPGKGKILQSDIYPRR
ncbi:anti-sigma factor family protein [Streptomyces sp. 8L]|uniref:anti-sigma factor family protein n=1 Tax=Streptomyces sp. 8L TaxID=2877242 RepID=UPI001CD1A56A|nr:hypothetical protein [Streptomyces sp. 8L]MCA1218913.1 hypothetical protein [Streptomyces sp. 8L]